MHCGICEMDLLCRRLVAFSLVSGTLKFDLVDTVAADCIVNTMMAE